MDHYTILNRLGVQNRQKVRVEVPLKLRPMLRPLQRLLEKQDHLWDQRPQTTKDPGAKKAGANLEEQIAKRSRNMLIKLLRTKMEL